MTKSPDSIHPTELKRIDVSALNGDQEVVLDEEGQQLEIVGAFSVAARETRSLHLKIIHRAAHTTARTILKGVVRNHGHLSLNGTIIVEHSARDTNSFLRENVLILSPFAVAEAVPNLEILTDDVKCSHAASISNVSAEQLFYLQSRGLSLESATNLIVAGFLQEVQ